MMRDLPSLRAAAFVCCWLTAGAPAATRADPVAFWSLDERQGAVIEDQTGNYNDGLLHNVVWCEGKLGGGLRFGGTGADTYASLSPIFVRPEPCCLF